jgi:cellulose synthase/poly-beta-1,6-N-acetylglucosamine synthase-like glycosyltransferase
LLHFSFSQNSRLTLRFSLKLFLYKLMVTEGRFARELARALGGWVETILAEDTDLTFRCCLAGYEVRYVIEAEFYTEARVVR